MPQGGSILEWVTVSAPPNVGAATSIRSGASDHRRQCLGWRDPPFRAAIPYEIRRCFVHGAPSPGPNFPCGARSLKAPTPWVVAASKPAEKTTSRRRLPAGNSISAPPVPLNYPARSCSPSVRKRPCLRGCGSSGGVRSLNPYIKGFFSRPNLGPEVRVYEERLCCKTRQRPEGSFCTPGEYKPVRTSSSSCFSRGTTGGPTPPIDQARWAKASLAV